MKEQFDKFIDNAGARMLSAFTRALHTFAQAVSAQLVVGVGINTFDWKTIISIALTATLLSFLKTIVIGSPEADGDMAYGTIVVDDTNADDPQVAVTVEDPVVPNPDTVKRVTMVVKRGTISDETVE